MSYSESTIFENRPASYSSGSRVLPGAMLVTPPPRFSLWGETEVDLPEHGHKVLLQGNKEIILLLLGQYYTLFFKMTIHKQLDVIKVRNVKKNKILMKAYMA